MQHISTYKFSLDRSSKKYVCPNCRHKRFVLYMDNETGVPLPEQVGRCDRENSCCYHYTPKQFFADNGEPRINPQTEVKKSKINEPINYLPFELMERSVSRHCDSDLFPFLVKIFRQEIADQLCKDYFVGTNKEGNTAFWQVDSSSNVRQCKIIQYMPNGHRNKGTAILFAGKKILGNNDANLKQCFFGELLLSREENKRKPVAIVESEKTALIASVYFKDFIWLATGGKNGAGWTKENVCKVLSGKKVIMFPDVNAFDSWKSRGLLMAATAGCSVVISDLLEVNATNEERRKGFDLADYLLKLMDCTGLALTDHQYPVAWDYLTAFESK